MSKKSSLRAHFGSQRGNGKQTLLKSTRKHCHPIVLSFWDKLKWKTSLLVRSEILELFVNNSLPTTSILAIKGRTYQNKFKCNHPRRQKIFLPHFYWIYQIGIRFWLFCQKVSCPSLNISDINDSKRRRYLNA